MDPILPLLPSYFSAFVFQAPFPNRFGFRDLLGVGVFELLAEGGVSVAVASFG